MRPEFDSVDYGLELVGDGGRVVGLEWTDRFDVWCGVWIVEGGIGKVGRAVWDVSERSRWSSMVGRCLTHVEVHWVDLESHERTKYVLPYSLELQFESDRVWIAAVEVAHTRDDYFLLRMTSHITVAFDEGAASEYGLLPLPN